MTQGKNFSHSYPELFNLIGRYAHGDIHQQAIALELLGTIYRPYYKLPPVKDARPIVESILEQRDYLFWYGGHSSLLGIDAVLSVAMVKDDPHWGWTTFASILQRLVQQDVGGLEQKGDLPCTLAEVAREFQELQRRVL